MFEKNWKYRNRIHISDRWERVGRKKGKIKSSKATRSLNKGRIKKTKSNAKNMVKVCIAERRAYEFIGKEGTKIKGFSYGGFLEDGRVISFTSRENYETSPILGYDESRAIELDIRPKIWGGTVKYREHVED